MLTGIISEGAGDKLIPEAEIYIGGTSTKTDSEGQFSVNISPGKYDLLVTKKGLGTGKFQDLDLTNTEEKNIQLILLKGGKTVHKPPQINVNNIQPGDTVSGQLELDINIDTPINIRQTKIKLSKTGYTSDRVVSYQNDFKLKDYNGINTRIFPNGKTFLTIKTRDASNNITKKEIPLNINNQDQKSDLSPPKTPGSFSVNSVTLGKTQGFFSIQGNIKNMNKNKFPRNTVIYNSLYLPGELPEGADGYRVLRSFDGENYELVCDIQQSIYDDTDGKIRPGKPVYYKIKAYNSKYFSEPTEPVKVIPLPEVNVNLISPEDGAQNTKTAPNLSWETTRKQETLEIKNELVKETAHFNITIYKSETENPYNPNDSDNEYWSFSITNKTEINFKEKTGENLTTNTGYRWDISSGYYHIEYQYNDHLVSAFSFLGDNTGSLNGEFTFITE